MNPNDPNQTPHGQIPAPVAAAPQINNPLSAMQPGETVICEIRRHPFGLFTMYASFIALLLIVGVVVLLAPGIMTNYDSKTVYEVGGGVFVVALLFCVLFGAIGSKVYNGNRWILTSDSLTQISQISLFNRQSSQLSLGNLEDVTSHQDGIIPHMFGFGVLHVETAGERSKFVFPYCPRPNEYAQKVLQAREAFEQGRAGEGGGQQRLYRQEGAYQQQMQQQPMPPQMPPQPQEQQAPVPPQEPYQYEPQPYDGQDRPQA